LIGHEGGKTESLFGRQRVRQEFIGGPDSSETFREGNIDGLSGSFNGLRGQMPKGVTLQEERQFKEAADDRRDRDQQKEQENDHLDDRRSRFAIGREKRRSVGCVLWILAKASGDAIKLWVRNIDHEQDRIGHILEYS
jgi:hypothetical protein